MTGAMILFGSSLFFLYALPKTGPGSAIALRWARPLLLITGATLVAASLLGFLAQTIVLAGSVPDGLQFDALSAALTGMSFGKSSLVRALSAVLFIGAFALLGRERRGWWIAAVAGAISCMSLAWMGLLATGGRQADDARPTVLHRALHGFSGIGSALVAVLVATGLINSWFVIGLAGLPRLWITPYGQLLTVKLVLFGVMVVLAAANRFHLTPRLGAALGEEGSTAEAVSALRGSLAWETAISIAVLALAAWFGMLAPPSVS
jgi:putative copper resistance protein D